jgi:SAM-dependent methyltransferase
MIPKMVSIASLMRRAGFGAPADQIPVSTGYSFITRDQCSQGLDGWRELSVAEAQHKAFRPILEEMRLGHLREDFSALVKAVQLCACEDQSMILEVGCGTGWNAEVLHRHLGGRLRYLGMDYSQAMTHVGRREYPQTLFLNGDAAALPLADDCCEIVLMGTVLMHLAQYESAIAEAARVASRWVILHTVPVLQKRQTTFMKKLAYGQPTAEVIFNESSLLQRAREIGLELRHTLTSLPYDLYSELGEHTVTNTYVCEVRG